MTPPTAPLTLHPSVPRNHQPDTAAGYGSVRLVSDQPRKAFNL